MAMKSQSGSFRVQKRSSVGLGANNVQVDNVHNLLIASGGRRTLIFDRTAEGNTKPLRVIEGPRTGLLVGQGMRVYPPTGKIIVNIPGARDEGLEEDEAVPPEALASERSFGSWSVFDNGDVAPLWKIAGPNGILRRPRGVVIDAKHKTLMFSDKYLNGVLTYSLPEMFEPAGPQQTAQR
jgi:hypothetical protein